MTLILCVSIYALSTVFIGFTSLFLLLGEGPLHAWLQYLDTVALQFAFPRRAPFALMLVTFVVAIPMILGLWHWLALREPRPGPGRVATRAAAVIFCGYLTLVTAVLSMAAAVPAFSVMENVNLQFGLMLLGAWSALAVALAMPAGAAVNWLVKSEVGQRSAI